MPFVKQIAEQISLRNVLDENIQPEIVKSLRDRIVLIGLSAPTNTNDFWETPFSANAKPSQKETPGVFVQAQMVSQILSAVLDRRPLLWWFPPLVEAVWVWGWSLIGGVMAWYCSKPLYLGVAVTVTLFLLFWICLGIFILSGWVPFIPSALAFLITQVMIVLLSKERKKEVSLKK